MSSYLQLTWMFFLVWPLSCNWVFSRISNCWTIELQNRSLCSLQVHCSPVSKPIHHPFIEQRASLTTSSPVYNHCLFITELLAGTSDYRPYIPNIFRHICSHGVAVTCFCFTRLAGSCPLGSAAVKQRRSSLPASIPLPDTDIVGR